MKTKVKHIPERGCHNCRLHYVNHKKCDAEFPCKQGIEWRPIVVSRSREMTKDRVEKYYKVEIKSEADLPKEDGIYFVHCKNSGKQTEFSFHENKEVWPKNIDWYLCPDYMFK